MNNNKNYVELLNFKHNREIDCKTTANQIFNLINDYTDQQELVKLYDYFDLTLDDFIFVVPVSELFSFSPIQISFA